MMLLDLFLGFLRVGCFAFGGAYGAIPLIREVVFSYGWLTDEALTNMIAVSESTPGPIMVNLATYIGSTQAGLLGSVVATVGVVLPSFCIILAVSAALSHVLKRPLVQAALRGLKPCMVGIVFATGIFMVFQTALPALAFDWKQVLLVLLLAAILFLAKPMVKRSVSPILFICIAAVLGIVFYGV